MSPAIGAAPDVYEWTAQVLRLRISEVLSFRGAALVPWNEPAIHDMRVALRRLRTALRDFARVIDNRQVRRIRNDLRRLARRLGVVRDADVAFIALNALEKDAPNENVSEGIREIAEYIEKRREHAHERFRASLASIDLDEIKRRLDEHISSAVRQRRLFAPAGVAPLGRSAIVARLNELHGLGPAVFDPTDSLRLHEVRIAVKRLRYSIELFAASFDGRLDETPRELAKMQTLLGELHDCDVWTADLGARLSGRRHGPSSNERAAAIWLLELFVRKRAKDYIAALTLWNRWQNDAFEGRIRRAIAAA